MIFWLALACTERAPTPPPNTPVSSVLASSPVNPDGSVVGSSSPPGAAPTPSAVQLSPEETYKLCEARVEGPSTPGECTKDSDCSQAGCSQEVCVAASKVGDIITTCEIQACFSVLSSCGCKEGVCAWTVAENARPMPRIFTPAELMAPTPAAPQ